MKKDNFDKYASSLIQAGQETAIHMTAQLRAQCLASGWDRSIANRVKVTFSSGGFKVVYPDEIKKDVENLEYGTPTTQPTAAFRRFQNRLDKAADYMMTRAHKIAGGL